MGAEKATDRAEQPTNRPTFADLLAQAINEPGTVASAYRAFHGYSLGNQMLAAIQCHERSIPLGPIASYQAWKDKGRHVKRGEKALWLWLPITVKVRRDESIDDGRRADEYETVTRFVMKPHWFVYAQTDGQEIQPEPIPEWDRKRALATLEISEIPFDLPDGNVQGFARGKSIAVSPVAAMPHKTTFHEMAHVLLGHTGDTVNDGADLPRNLREVEAESVAYLCLESLGLPGGQYARGYVQHWIGSERIPEASCARIFKVADSILRAGHE
jgi:N-terminal domain of anti-restriction factor ArdC